MVQEGEEGAMAMEFLCVSLETAESSNDDHGHRCFQDIIRSRGCGPCLHTLLLLPLLWLQLLNYKSHHTTLHI